MTDNPFAVGYVEPEPAPDTFREDFDIGDPKPKRATSGLVYHMDIEQGSIEWLNARKGVLTASEFKLILTPSLKFADNKEKKTHLYELLAQRVIDHVEPHFQSYDMERGNFDEEHARNKYSETYAKVTECGFITNDKLGFVLGYSPDGLVADDGLIECKSRVQKWQMQTLIECVAENKIPAEFMMQVQSGLFISERKWLDFISYSGGMMMAIVRCYPIPEWQAAITAAAINFERSLAESRAIYDMLMVSDARLIPTERLLYL
jgi:hypothetical protein